jgi:hypothetical protein
LSPAKAPISICFWRSFGQFFFFRSCVPSFRFNSQDAIPGIYWLSEIPVVRTQKFLDNPKLRNVHYFIFLKEPINQLNVINEHCTGLSWCVTGTNTKLSHGPMQRCVIIRYGTIWYDMIWCDMMWCDVMWCDAMWYDVIWCDMMWYDVIWCDMMWYDVMWCDVIWCDMIWYVMIYNIYLLSAIGLPPGGSSTVHIYTQTVHRIRKLDRMYRTEHT